MINKGHGVARKMFRFSALRTTAAYCFCIKELEDVLCVNRVANTFGGWTLGGKLRQQEKDEIECEITDYGRYSFNPQAWMEAFGEFNALLYSQPRPGRYSHVLQFDLSNFLATLCASDPCSNAGFVKNQAAEKGWIITLLFYLLNQWNRRNTGVTSLRLWGFLKMLSPIAPILFNYYLQRYDKFAETFAPKQARVFPLRQ